MSLFMEHGDRLTLTRLRAQACLAELIETALTLGGTDDLVCEVAMDAEHLFVSVEYDGLLPTRPSSGGRSLGSVRAVADDCGSYSVEPYALVWAAVRQQ
ncbi:hypothetical protein ABT024_05270 [Streptomyces sp. NPDC002812]|uniref:hypothetical protein n=1 Tax=Streptomyces sp. NPDC002812 TaxID=3154434 RepID=UPI003320138F